MFGVHLQTAQIVNLMPFKSTQDYESYLKRWRKIPVLFDQVIEVLRQGKKDKLMPPDYLLQKAAEQCNSIAEPAMPLLVR